MVAVELVGPVAALGEAEQAVPVEVHFAADLPAGASTAVLAASLVVIAVAEAVVVAVPGFAGVLTGDAAVAQLDFARLDFAFWKQASFALGDQVDRIVLAGQAGLDCSVANSHVALPSDIAVPVAVPAAPVAAVAVVAAAGLVAAAVGLEHAAAAAVAVA